MTTLPLSQDTISAVLAALQVFSGQPNKASIDAANQWLQEFQHTPQAWTTSNYLLFSPESPSSAKTFAAQTFRAKVTFDLHQVDAAHKAALRDSFVSALRKFASGPRVVLVQISLALSGLALQMSEWKTVLPDLIASLGRDPETVPALLEFLRILPEEATGNTRIPMSNDEYRAREAELLTDNASEVLELLTMYMQAQGVTDAIHEQIFQCLRSWVVAGEVEVAALAQTPLFDFTFKSLSSDNLFDSAVDVVCEIIHETQEVEDNMVVIEHIMRHLLSMRPTFAASKDDPDKVRGYCRIFTEAGETYRVLLLAHPESFFPLVEAIADCAAYTDLDVVQITFNFWYRLSQSIGRHPSVPAQFLDLYKGLVNVMIGHLHHPLDPDSVTAQERDEFRGFRHVMGDTLKDCCYVLGSTACLRTAYDMIVAALAKQDTVWQQIEAPLFSMRSMGAEVDPDDDEVVPLIMDLIPKLPPHPRIRYAATLVISRYTEWIDRHPQYIQFQLAYISDGFNDPDGEVAAAAGQAVKYMCKDCKQHLVPFLPQLHTFVQTVAKSLRVEDRLEIYEAIAHVISYMPMEQAAQALRKFTLELMQSIHDTLTLAQPAKDQVQGISDNLECVTVMLDIIQTFGEQLPVACQNTCGEVWTVFDALIQRYGNLHFMTERACNALRLGLFFFGDHALPVIPALLERLGAAFEGSGFASYIWICAKVVSRFGNEEDTEIRESIKTVFERISNQVFSLLKVQEPSDIPDVIEDYIHFLVQMLDYAPNVLFLSPSYPTVFRATLSALTLYHAEVVIPTLEFIHTLYQHDCLSTKARAAQPPNFPLYASAIKAATDSEGFSLLSLLLVGLLSSFPEDVAPLVTSIIRSLTQLFPQQMLAWMPAALEAVPAQSLPAEARATFANEFSSAIASGQPEKAKQAVVNLNRASRRARERNKMGSMK